MSAIAEVTFSRQVALKALLALEIGHPLAQQAFSVGRKLLAPGAGKRITLFAGPPGRRAGESLGCATSYTPYA